MGRIAQMVSPRRSRSNPLWPPGRLCEQQGQAHTTGDELLDHQCHNPHALHGECDASHATQ